ncbi:trehalose-phosphatase [Natrialba sp. PRR66]|uniref:trehalose-phosphatase n=1 Tax=Natrialba sp. PRR66 TaxID=3098146 RepID=UPI002B1CE3AC|nr:trehalose-phosphatase [Natrialba sp. PRR66]
MSDQSAATDDGSDTSIESTDASTDTDIDAGIGTDTDETTTDDSPHETPLQPPPLLTGEHLPQLRATLANATHLLVCLDFDGTLAPIVDEPDAAAPTTANETAVAGLVDAAPVTTAIVSGRSLADVRTRIDGPRIYAGNHGLELAWNETVAVHPVAHERAARLETVCEALETVLGPIPNVRIENKRLTGTVHVRTVPPAARPTVRRLTRTIVDRFGGDELDISPGKRILEIGPTIDWGKGDAVDVITSTLPDGTVPLYIGDDVTDESAFRAIDADGISIRVGDDDPSTASFRVRSPAAVARVLDWLGTAGVELVGQRTQSLSGTELWNDDPRVGPIPERWPTPVANE